MKRMYALLLLLLGVSFGAQAQTYCTTNLYTTGCTFGDYIDNATLNKEERLNIKSAVKKLTIPHLIIHGNNDTSVSLKEGKNLHKWNPNCELNIIDGADHVFNTKHPWEKEILSAQLKDVAELIEEFINKKA